MSIELIQHLLIIVGIVGPIIIALYMLLFLLGKRCPLCGSKMRFNYKGDNVVSYTCDKCKHY